MDVIVNDTNIFIDLQSVGLLGAMCELPFEIHTLDLVVAELTDPTQRADVVEYVSRQKIKVHSLSSSELVAVAVEHSSAPGNLSFQDVAVCQYARSGAYKLLTGDRQLRNYAEKQRVEVHGIIFLIDEMVAENIITPQLGASKLKELLAVNVRLPKSEISVRIERWEKNVKSD